MFHFQERANSHNEEICRDISVKFENIVMNGVKLPYLNDYTAIDFFRNLRQQALEEVQFERSFYIIFTRAEENLTYFERDLNRKVGSKFSTRLKKAKWHSVNPRALYGENGRFVEKSPILMRTATKSVIFFYSNGSSRGDDPS